MTAASAPSTAQGAPGRLWVFTAPSGAGKSTLVRALLARRGNLVFSVSCTTRPPRPGEMHGRDYFFVTRAQFAQKIAADEMLEHAEVFGNHYGTERQHVEQRLAAGLDVLLEIDWQGARQIRARMPQARLVFILPPSIEELTRRLRSRGTDDQTVVARRLGQARDDIAHWPEFDYAVVNDSLDTAIAQLTLILDGQGQEFAVGNPQHRERIVRIRASD